MTPETGPDMLMDLELTLLRQDQAGESEPAKPR